MTARDVSYSVWGYNTLFPLSLLGGMYRLLESYNACSGLSGLFGPGSFKVWYATISLGGSVIKERCL